MEIDDSEFTAAVTKLWMLVMFVGLAVNGYFGYSYQSQIFYPYNSVGYINNVSSYLAVFVTVFVGLVEAQVKKKYQMRIFQKLQALDGKFETLGQEYSKFYVKITRKIWISNLVTMVVETLTYQMILQSMFRVQWQKFWFLTWPLLVLARCKHQIATFYVDLVGIYLNILVNELEILKETLILVEVCNKSHGGGGGGKCKEIVENAKQKLIFLKYMYGEIWFASTDVAEAFGWSEALNFVQNAIQIVCNAYWIYDCVKRVDYGTMVPTVLVIVPVFVVALVTVQSAEECVRLVRKVGGN
jgi:hypothetical protein